MVPVLEADSHLEVDSHPEVGNLARIVRDSWSVPVEADKQGRTPAGDTPLAVEGSRAGWLVPELEGNRAWTLAGKLLAAGGSLPAWVDNWELIPAGDTPLAVEGSRADSRPGSEGNRAPIQVEDNQRPRLEHYNMDRWEADS
jgi:hypothetical protein